MTANDPAPAWRSPYWHDRRVTAHDAGRHIRPQIDCRPCWDAGAFADIAEPEPIAEPVPVHDGRHGAACIVCASR